jgi:hypothetical protein
VSYEEGQIEIHAKGQGERYEKVQGESHAKGQGEIYDKEQDKSRAKRQGKSYGIKSRVLIRDVVRKVDLGMQVVLISLENQTDIHYAMPIRVMDADASIYRRQWKQKSAEHRKNKDLKGAEFLSGFSKKDKLMPTLTLVIYFGSTPWDGPKNLKDMMDLSGLPEYLRSMIADYPIQLLEVRKYEHPEYFHTDLQYVFGFLKNASNQEKLAEYVEEHEAEFSNIDEQAYDMISCMSKSSELKIIKRNYQEDEGGGVNMCQAIKDMIAEGKKEGIKEGKREGIKEGEKRFASLTLILLKENQIEALMRATEDETYCTVLYEKYHL